MHAARPEAGARLERGVLQMYYHSPESWAALWDGEVCTKGTVRVETRLVPVEKETPSGEKLEYWVMEWSVTRL